MKRIIFLLLFMFVSSPAWASDEPKYEPAPTWVKAAPPVDLKTVKDDSPIYLIDDIQTRIDGDQSWRYVDLAQRVASPQMLDSAGTVKIDWNPDLGDLIIHSVQILRPEGTVDVLQSGGKFSVLRRELKLEKRILDGQRTASMTVPGLRVGDVLEIRYSITQRDAALNGQVQLVNGLPVAPLKIGYGRMRVIWPEKQPIKWHIMAHDINVTPETHDGMTELSFTLPLPKPHDMPKDAPLRYKSIPLLEVTSFPDWQSVSRTMAPLYSTNGLIEPDSALAAEVAKIRAAEKDPLKRAELALRLVQDKISYFFNGMDGGNYVPQKPAETWKLRYGDCKAKTLLLLLLLHELGIDAEPVLANLTLGGIVPERLTLPGAFDHVLVLAHIGGHDYWLDGTDRGTRLADIADVPNLKHVLPVRAEGSGLMDVPYKADVRPDLASDLEFDNRAGLMLPSLFKLNFMIRGALAEKFNTSLKQLDTDKKVSMVQSLLKPMVGATIISTYDFSFDSDQSAITIKAAGVTNSPWVQEDRVYTATLDQSIGQLDFSPDRARATWQKLPVALGSPSHIVSKQTYFVPGQAKDYKIEGDRKFDTPIVGVRIDRNVKIDNDRIMLSDDRQSVEPEIAVDQISAVKTELARAKSHLLKAKASDFPSRVSAIEAARKKNLIKPMLDVYQAQIDRYSDDADKQAAAYADRANFQQIVYDFKAALSDLDRVIKQNPSAENYQWRSGVRLRSGDKLGALADAREAYRLDPGKAQYASDLALLLVRNGQKSEAVTLVDKWIDQGGKQKSSMMITKADVLARFGDRSGTLEVLKQALDTGPVTASLLNSECWIRGLLGVELDVALKQCSRAIEMADSALPALDSRALIYFRLGRYPEALADLKAVLDENPDMTSSRYLRGLVKLRMGDKSGGNADLQAARVADPNIDDNYKPYGIKL